MPIFFELPAIFVKVEARGTWLTTIATTDPITGFVAANAAIAGLAASADHGVKSPG